MFDKWAENFTWDKNHDELVKAIFNTCASKRFSRMMEDVREKKEHLTQWCRPELKKALYHYWETDEKYLHLKQLNADVEALKEQLREELRLMQEHRR
ncbi:hypothetical protein PIB30_087741 [Stylosanthes scabra]|uniref:Uncharacterized protein n=1 Tax=Stylosanthes scabra TaxID=79078 RepID=A0ABU6XVV6_9FABA|nr:hypothetical protein [Stylosanthes scabra]